MRRKQLTPDDIKEIKQESWRVIVGGILINIIVGSFYAFGAYSIYLASYFKSQDVGVTSDGVALIFPFMYILMNSLIPFGEKVVNNLGNRQAIFVGVFLLSTFYYLLAQIKSMALWGLIAIFLIAPVYGLMYMLPFFCSWRYFPTSPGNVNAVLQTGFGLGGCLFSYFAYELVNFQNQEAKHIVIENSIDRLYFEECISYNTPSMLKVFSAVIAIFGSLALFLLWKPINENLDHYREQLIKNNSNHMQKSLNEQLQIPLSECISLKQGVLSKSFLMLSIMALCSSFFGFFAMSYYKIYGLLQSFDDESLTWLGGLSFAVFGCSRALWNKAVVKLGFRKSFFFIQISMVFVVTLFTNLGQYFSIYSFCIMAMIFLQGGVFTWFSTFTPKVFGYRYASLIFGLILVGFALSNLLLHGITYYTFQSGPNNFHTIYILVIILHVTASGLLYVFNENPKWI